MDTLRIHRHLLSLTGAIAFLAAAGVALGEGDSGDYLTPIKQELARLDMTARCDDSSKSCFITLPAEDVSTPERHLVIRYSAVTDTVYLYMDRFIRLETSELSPSLAMRLLALNSELVTAKFEWDRAGQAIRLSTVLNTDSNFDRRAFRSQLLGLLKVAARLWPELHATADSPPSTQGSVTNPSDNQNAP